MCDYSIEEISAVCDSIGTTASKHLLALHALSGCDSTSYLYGHGRASVFWKQAYCRKSGQPSYRPGRGSGLPTRLRRLFYRLGLYIRKCFAPTGYRTLWIERRTMWELLGSSANKCISIKVTLSLLCSYFVPCMVERRSAGDSGLNSVGSHSIEKFGDGVHNTTTKALCLWLIYLPWSMPRKPAWSCCLCCTMANRMKL